ncbi:lytic transglycosylase domain-containing protein [Amycolatopsis sp. H20-H5]|uniref:lytic transglycosylase domain-containing protein n=1 Tax=Amycolatopsis sp. H20-H5 TaxID=3046309 RepID=UPI002DBF490A|nr:lytic transglycosylase domain-containing protein [Amycolatopsis sp. H20-H5]MEC3975958.1 lytic transglycosylase domain-containing protein [Amycolatopsis sp. H20-H5]
MRVRHRPGAIGGLARRLGRRHRTLLAITGGVLAVVPAFAASGGAASWVNVASTVHSSDVALEGGYDPILGQGIGVDGSLPNSPSPLPLPAYELPNGPLGIPSTALDAYKKAAGILTGELPGCHVDWALIASIGRIESNHARGGYVDAKGTTLEPILGPVLNGAGPFAAVPDTDQGRFDGDKVWDRAVGPMQFIPSTWWGYASDGNGDGESNPNNIYDASLATGRYLCSGGLDLSSPDPLRAAIYRYNNSDTYVNTVILWAEAYRNGVLPTADSKVPVGAPNAAAAPPPAEVPPPPVPPTPTPGTSAPTLPPTQTTGTSTSTQTSTTPSPTCTPTTTTVTLPTTSPPNTTTSPPGSSTTPAPPSPSCTSPTTTTTTTTASPTASAAPEGHHHGV